MRLREQIEAIAAKASSEFTDDDLSVFEELKRALNRGEVRAAEKDANGKWIVNAWVKQGLLIGFRMGSLVDMSTGGSFRFFDKDTYPARPTTIDENVRIVPGGSTIRDGAYVAPGVVCMPPMFVNAGAYIDEGTMIDSHALVGSCAQIGKRVHISAAAQIGGVLEPVRIVPDANTARSRTIVPSYTPQLPPTSTSSSMITGTAPTGSSTPPICAAAEM